MNVKKSVTAFLSVLTVLVSLCPVSASAPDPLFSEEPSRYVSVFSEAAPPTVSAASAILVDTDGTVLFEKDADRVMSPASTTKIMTALTVLENEYDLSAAVSIPRDAVGVEGSSVYLYEGEHLTLEQLLYAMLMESANDAAAAIALHTAGTLSGFADRMNEIADELGLRNTHFMNPHGLDHEEHRTSARELAEITCAAMEYPVFREMVSTYKKEIPLKGTEGTRLLVNHNRLLKSLDGCIGVKTGFTKKSGRCLVSACERDGVLLICVTMQAPDDWNDHTALYEWGFARVEHVTLSCVGEQYAEIPVVGAVSDTETVMTVAVRNEEALAVNLPRGEQKVRKTVCLPHFLYAPVTAGDVVGYVVYKNNGTEIGRLPLYASESAEQYRRPTLTEWIKQLFKS